MVGALALGVVEGVSVVDLDLEVVPAPGLVEVSGAVLVMDLDQAGVATVLALALAEVSGEVTVQAAGTVVVVLATGVVGVVEAGATSVMQTTP